MNLDKSLDRFKERECPACKEKITPIYFENKSFGIQRSFKSVDFIPKEIRGEIGIINIYILGCPECKNLFFDYIKR